MPRDRTGQEERTASCCESPADSTTRWAGRRPLGPAGGPGGVRWFSAEVKSRSFKLSAEMKDGKVTDTVRRIP
ncbi:hypothetical protein ACFQYP_20100 [Nonomuraea antimicrobica]